jgi:hypothetical protein
MMRSEPLCSHRRLLTWLLVYLVLAGGIYPALYESQLPHDHLFVGGPPPADWENHSHENPLFVFFGPPAGMGDASDEEQLRPAATGHPPAAGRVVSVYPGVPGVVFSIFTVTTLAPAIGTLAVLLLSSRLAFPRGRWPVILAEGPATPPPRPA